MSKGEDKIARLLQRGCIAFEREKNFEDLRAGRYRFDFYCPYVFGKPAVIEVNGEQHYKRVPQFHKSITDFKKGQEHDRRKISYCLANGINIYCIPFWELDGLKDAVDLFSTKFLAKSRWHNDEVWTKRQSHQ